MLVPFDGLPVVEGALLLVFRSGAEFPLLDFSPVLSYQDALTDGCVCAQTSLDAFVLLLWKGVVSEWSGEGTMAIPHRVWVEKQDTLDCSM